MPSCIGSSSRALCVCGIWLRFFACFFSSEAAVLFDQPPLSSPFLGTAVHYIRQQTADVLQVAGQMVTNPPSEVSLIE